MLEVLTGVVTVAVVWFVVWCVKDALFDVRWNREHDV